MVISLLLSLFFRASFLGCLQSIVFMGGGHISLSFNAASLEIPFADQLKSLVYLINIFCRIRKKHYTTNKALKIC